MDDPCDRPGPAEHALVGGGMGGAVRVGGTVRRTAGPWTPTVQRLLAHLRAAGVPGVPEPLGTDERGRDVTAYLPGTVPQYPMPGWVWRDEVLVDAARALRRVHDASVGFDTAGAVWRLPATEPAEVVCHNDTSPDNMVFRDEELVGLVDWDTAAPGPRIRDVAYLAYRLVPLGPAAADPGPVADDRRARRIALVCEAYGGLGPTEVVGAITVRLRDLAAFTEARAGDDVELRRHSGLYRADAAWVEVNAAVLAP